jgi:hypothetical protein
MYYTIVTGVGAAPAMEPLRLLVQPAAVEQHRPLDGNSRQQQGGQKTNNVQVSSARNGTAAAVEPIVKKVLKSANGQPAIAAKRVETPLEAPVKLLSKDMIWDDTLMKSLRDTSDFTVVGILGK